MVALALAAPAYAEGERAGDFDYYVAALSWSATWCALEGAARGEPQCDAGRGVTFVLHGLWPQHEDGWPSYCRTVERDPSRGETAAVADVFGGAGAAFYQWKKHGRCSGLSARDFYATARRVREGVRIPAVFAQVNRRLEVPASVIEGAFVEANPGLDPGMVTVTCRDGMIAEVRLCLTRDLAPRACGADAARDCRMPDAVLLPLR
ncbi:MAG: ribonuclease T2 family protein [Gemmobacter sp.]